MKLSYFTFALIGLCLALCIPNKLAAQYSLVVTSEPALNPELTKYKMFIKLNVETDRVSAIYGTDKDVMWIEAPEGVFNSPFNSGWSASGMNPLFFEAMPEMVDDSYATIGLFQPATDSPLGSEDPIMVEDRGNPWTTFFKENGASRLDINTTMGGSWFTLKTSTNGLGDDNGLVLIAQITTSGSIRGQVNAQIFPEGNGKNNLRVKFEFNGTGETQGEILTNPN
ncbi:MAG: hypothetical protein COA49_08685 [Bacteroidetes bacterium]|nr:MAG: hypothetical protein COA49_08685 [Bacteroidota bacterium]